MSNNGNRAAPSAEDLHGFREQISEVIGACENLRTENLSLRKQALGLMEEKKDLIKVNEMARERLQVLIGRLREIESMRQGSKTDPDQG